MKHFIDLFFLNIFIKHAPLQNSNTTCYRFICNLFNDTVSNSEDTALNDGMTLNNYTERVWKGATVV